MEYILVGVGGIFGSLTRFWLGRFIAQKSKAQIPFGTFLVNISGAVMLGVFIGMGLQGNAYVMLGDGFLGAYTTFSTFMYEGFNLFKHNHRLNAFTYIAASLIIGILGFFIGIVLVRLIKF